MAKKILFLYKTPRGKIYRDWKNGLTPDTILYGANHLEKMGYSVEINDKAFSFPFKWLFYPLTLVLNKTVGLGFKLDQALLLLPSLIKSDMIISTVDTAGLPILLLKRLKLIDTPVIYISVDFALRLAKSRNFLFRIYKSLLKEASLVICYSDQERKILRKINNNVQVLTPGTDVNYYSKLAKKINTNKTKILLSFGRDSQRDYKTLIKAVEGISVKTQIICDPSNLKRLKIPSDVSVEYNLDANKLAKKIINADFVVIPSKKTIRATGQLSFLDALACKKPVIIARVPGIINAYKPKNGYDCLMYSPEDFTSLKKQINILLKDNLAKSKLATNGWVLVQNYSTLSFAKDLELHIKRYIS